MFTIVEVKAGEGSAAGWGLLKAYEENRDGWVSLIKSISAFAASDCHLIGFFFCFFLPISCRERAAPQAGGC